MRAPAVSSRKRSSSRLKRSSGVNARIRAAASSIASGRQSRRSQSVRDRHARRRVASNDGATARARSDEERDGIVATRAARAATAPHRRSSTAHGSSSARAARRQRPTRSSTISRGGATTCSQLSRISSASRSWRTSRSRSRRLIDAPSPNSASTPERAGDRGGHSGSHRQPAPSRPGTRRRANSASRRRPTSIASAGLADARRYRRSSRPDGRGRA